MTAKLSIYCIATVSSPPAALTRRENGAFYCHVAVPVAEQLVIFCEGEWEKSNPEYDVTLTYKDDEIVLGKIVETNKCLVWKRELERMPASMMSESEKGLAKIVVEKCEDLQLPVDVEMAHSASSILGNELKELNENTPQFVEDLSKEKNAPERPKKRRSSLNKEDKTPSGPVVKKQKTNTRMRNLKTDNSENENGKKGKTASPKTPKEGKQSATKTENVGKTSSPKTPKEGKQSASKTENVEKAKSVTKEGKVKTPKAEKEKKEPNTKLKKKTEAETHVAEDAKREKEEKDTPKTKRKKSVSVESPKVESEAHVAENTKHEKEKKEPNTKVKKKNEAEIKVAEDTKREKEEKDTPKTKRKKSVCVESPNIESEQKATIKAKTKKDSESLVSPKAEKKETTKPKRKKTSEGIDVAGIKKYFSSCIKDSETDNKKTDLNTKPSEPDTQKSTKSTKRKSEQKKTEVLGELEENKGSRRSRRSCTDVKTDGNADSHQSGADKENVDTNVAIVDDAISDKNNTLEKITSIIPASKSTGPNPSETGKIATCRDVTLRALERPSARWGHSFCFVNRKLSVLIGGQGEKSQLCKDSVWTLDTETRRWKDPETLSESQKPEYRMGHTATYDPIVRCIYVFGGSKNTRWFHDVHMLDLDEWKWQLIKVNGKAPTRAYHSATLYRHEVWIFGGVYPRPDPQPDGCSNDIHIFSPVMDCWYSPIVSGEKPIPRSGHSATLLDDQLVIFGGWDAPISYSDLYVLDMSIVEWSQPEFTGTPPSPRSWHASCALRNNRLLIHGGYNGDFALDDTHIFNLDKKTWTQISMDSKLSARVGHKCLCMPYRHDNEEEDEIIIFGGGDNDGAYFDDLYSIYVPFSA